MYKKHIKLALKNIIEFGDTDVFPYPIEKHVFEDEFDDSIKLIEEVHNNFDSYFAKHPPSNINTLLAVGYTGFRWVTLIDPIWNAYFLSLIISIADKIEKARIPKGKGTIHSYRFNPGKDNSKLFDENYNWFSFQEKSLEIVEDEKWKYVTICDISDFYNRVYHHPIKNALLQIIPDNNKVVRIDSILFSFSKNKSYGLPVGGPAARILAEISLNNVDRLLQLEGIKFTRFVDDIHIFSENLEDAHNSLSYVAKKINVAGLTLQKHKTQILSRAEFINLLNTRIKAESDDENTREVAKFMTLPIRYDPYSVTAREDYKKIKANLDQFDILGLLNEELRKTRIHQQFSKRLLEALKVLEKEIVSPAFVAIADRIAQLYPIFPNLMISAFTNFEKLDNKAKNIFLKSLQTLVIEDSYIINLEINAAYLVRVLGKEHSPENEEVIRILYKKFSNSPLLRVSVMRVVSKWKIQYWLQEFKENFQTMSKWERKIFIISSYFLKDEGRHWRDHWVDNFTDEERLIRDWAGKKINDKNWNMPI